MTILSKLRNQKLSNIIFFAFLITIPFNLRVIYQPESAYINGYFSSFLAIFLYLSDLSLAACFIAFIIEQYKKLSLRFIKNPYFWLVLAFLLTSVWGWFHVEHIGLAFYNLAKLLEFVFLITFISYNAKNFLFIKHSALIIYLSGIFQAVIGIIQFQVQHDLGLRFLGEYIAPLGTGGLATLDTAQGKIIRAYGTFPHPNIFGAFLCVSLIFGYWFVSRATSQKIKIYLGLFNIVLIIGVFLSFSRVAWLVAALVSLAIIFYLKLLTNHNIYGQIVITTLISSVVILVAWPKLIFSRIVNSTDVNSFLTRSQYNQIGLKILRMHPMGTGLGNYIPTMVSKFDLEPWVYQPPHNIFIYIAASMGLIGLALFVVYLAIIILQIINRKPTTLRFVLLTVAASLLLMSLFDHFLVTIQQGQLLFFTSLGLITGYNNISDEHIT